MELRQPGARLDARARPRAPRERRGRPRVPRPGVPTGRAPSSGARAAARGADAPPTSPSSSADHVDVTPDARAPPRPAARARARRSSSRRAITPPRAGSSARSASAGPRQSPSASARDAAARDGIVPLERAGPLVREPLEPLEVESAGLDADEVAGATRLDRLLAERLAEPRDVSLDEVRGRARRVVAPQPVDESRSGHDRVRMAEEEDERRALLRCPEVHRLPVHRSLERAEDAVLTGHRPTLLRCGGGAARLPWRHVRVARALSDPCARPAPPSPLGEASDAHTDAVLRHTAGRRTPSLRRDAMPMPFHRYRPYATVELPDRTWPDTVVGRAPDLVLDRPARREPGTRQPDGHPAQAPLLRPARPSRREGDRGRLPGGLEGRLRLLPHCSSRRA